jgi:hypothetical protein
MLTSGTGNTATTTNTFGTFRNYAFCDPTASTNTNHSLTRFRGYTGGTWDWNYSVSKSGDCDWLLHYDYYLSHP